MKRAWHIAMVCGFFGLFMAGCAVESKDSPTETYQQKNFLFNSNFALWQRGKSFDVGNGKGAYGADRWYVKNTLGDNSNIRYSREEPTLAGSSYGARVEISAPPTANEKNGCELYQTLDNATTLAVINETMSFSIKVRALGRTDQIAIQLLSNDTEKMVDKPISGEMVYRISPNHFTTVELNQIKIQNIPRGGVVGVRIRLLGRADGDGNAYDRGNGFVVEQAMLNPGVMSSPYTSKYTSFDAEELGCQRFFEKSFPRDQDPPRRNELFGIIGQTTAIIASVFDKTPPLTVSLRPKRVVPQEAQIGIFPNKEPGVAVLKDRITESSFQVGQTAEAAAAGFNWTVDTEIYE